MAVTVFVKSTGEKFRGKFATIDGDLVGLFSDARLDGKGGLRGCGKKTVLIAADVDLLAHQPDIEIQSRNRRTHAE